MEIFILQTGIQDEKEGKFYEDMCVDLRTSDLQGYQHRTTPVCKGYVGGIQQADY